MSNLPLALNEVDAMLAGAGRVLMATDFDGTLCPIVDSPSEVVLAPTIFEPLCRAAECRRLQLAVISGRSSMDVRRRLPLDIVFAGNHGLEITGGGLSFEHEGAKQRRFAVAGACVALRALQHRWPAAWIEDKGLSATLHYRNVHPREDDSLLFDARRCLRAFGPELALRAGKRALEVRPKVEWDKGDALKYIQEKTGPYHACICIGDDRTDENMFLANRGQFNIRIGLGGRTAATYCFDDPDDVAIFLSYIVSSLSTGDKTVAGEVAASYQAAGIRGASLAAKQ